MTPPPETGLKGQEESSPTFGQGVSGGGVTIEERVPTTMDNLVMVSWLPA